MEILFCFCFVLSYKGLKVVFTFLSFLKFFLCVNSDNCIGIVINGNFFFSDNMDASELKQFFETNYSQIYFIFYENFITLENSLKLKGKHFYKFFFIYFFFF